jgi:hypothetical protein
MMNGQVFLKENLSNISNKNFVTSAPLKLPSADNKFVNGSVYYEAVNNV